jgi:two-component system, LytTR family, response regulator
VKIVLIASDKEESKNLLQYINSRYTYANVLDTVYTLKQAIKILDDLDPEIIFADAQLSDGDIFSFLEKTNSVHHKIILFDVNTSLYRKALKYNIFDFLERPYNLKQIDEVFEKLKAIDYKDEDHLTKKKTIPKKSIDFDHCNKKIVLATDNSIYVVDINDIMQCQADYGYTVFYLQNNTNIMVTRTLKDYETLLSPYQFIRTHKSHLVNFKFIHRFSYEDGGVIFLKNNSSVPVSFRKRDMMIKTLSSLAIN